MNYTGPKIRKSRKLGIALTPKARKYMERRPYGPGQHGQSKKRNKTSVYGQQLFEKQKLRLQYNIHERQMSNYFAKAARLVGNTGEILIQMLESRLDALVFRSGMARSMPGARQLVGHGHVLVNGKPVDIPSYQVRPNDVISIRDKARKNDTIQESIRGAVTPAYIELSKADFSAKLLYLPPREEVPVVCDVPLVIEYYSR